MMIAKRNDPSITVRFPETVLERARQAAKDNKRSLNSEIVIRVSDSLNSPKKTSQK